MGFTNKSLKYLVAITQYVANKKKVQILNVIDLSFNYVKS